MSQVYTHSSPDVCASVQLGIIDLQAMLWALAAAVTACAPRLSPTKPTSRLCSKPIIVPILECLVLAAVTQTVCVVLMHTELHVTPGSDTHSATVRLGTLTCVGLLCRHTVLGSMLECLILAAVLQAACLLPVEGAASHPQRSPF